MGSVPVFRAIVVGGSLGGLFAANLLHDLGWQVDVYEKVPNDLASRGAGIGTHQQLVDALAALGIGMDERLGFTVGDRVCVDRAGNEVYRIPWAHTMSAWGNIYRPLKDRFPAQRYHFDKAFATFSREGEEVVAHFEDGSEARGDLLIGADGLRSAVRGQLFPGLEPAFAGYIAWRGLVPEGALGEAARRSLAHHYWMVLPPGEQMLAYLVPAKEITRTDRRLDWNYVWYRPIGDALLRDISTDADGRYHGMAMPPPLIRPEVIERIRADARAMLPAPLAEIVERAPSFFQTIFDVESPRLAVGRVALLGDAAFVARPHVGMGVTKAALDALCLARSIAATPRDLDAALARYERLRGEFGRRCIARARFVGAYIEARSRPQRRWSAEELDQRPERVLKESAAKLSDIPELASLEI